MAKQETKALIKKGTGPFSQFDFDFLTTNYINNKSYQKEFKQVPSDRTMA
jgi:hypothetical protein